MNKWDENVLTQMEKSLSGAREKDLRFFRIDELRRNIGRVGHFSDNCHQCRSFKGQIESVLVHVEEAVNVPGYHRRELDRLIARLSRHMMLAHNYYPPYHFNYLYTTYGLLAGLALSMAVIFLVNSRYGELSAALLFIISLLAGQIIGAKKDRKIRSEKRLM